jgi:hypothetical protein
MRLLLILLPAILLGLAGCVVTPPATSSTVVTPVPSPPATVYTTPGTATVITP